MGSRAKLADVPKVHQMIEERIRATIASKLGEYRMILPGVGVDLSGEGGMRIPGGLPAGMKRKTVDVFVK
jgi:maintenance of morphology protein 1